MSLIFINPYSFSAPWTPANITTALWLDSNDSSTITQSGGVVSQWDDKSGNARHLSQATPALRPTYDATGFNSLPTIQASSSLLSTNVNVSGFSGGASLWGVAAATMESTTPGNGRLFSFGQFGVNNDYDSALRAAFILRTGSSNAIYAYRVNPKSTANVSLNTPSIFGSVFNGTDHIAYVDGTAASAVSSTGNFTSAPILGLFRDNAPGSGALWVGKCSEFILGDTTLSAADRERIEGYLAHKWALTGSLPAGHPYKTTAPTV